MKYGPIAIYKKIGQTPLMALENLRFENPEWVDLPMTYAGRLDPTAEGLLLVLVGEDCKEKDKYLGLSKEYELSILFGFGILHSVLLLLNRKIIFIEPVQIFVNSSGLHRLNLLAVKYRCVK